MALQAQTKTGSAKPAPKPAAAAKTAQLFAWEGADKRGKKTKGEISSASMAAAKAELRRQGIVVGKIKKKSKPLFKSGGGSIAPLDIAVFSRQLATMLKAGVPLIQSFDIVAEGLDKESMRKLVLDVKAEVEAGNSLANALRRHPFYFDDLFCSLVNSGETSGALETMLDRIATYKEKTEQLKAKVKKAMKYPIAVLIVAAIVTAILLIKVVPTFKELFAGFGADLPAFTMFVIGISEWMQANWWIMLLVIIGISVSFTEAKKRSPAFNEALDKITLKLPVIGGIVYQSTVARYARTLATTFAAGVPLVEALDSVAGATGNIIYKRAVLKIKEDVSTGQQLQFSMRATGLFPTMAVQMVAIGEESGALDTMLDKVATHFESEVDNAVDGLTSLMEPMIMAFLGVVVGGLIVAMYLPIFKLGAAV